MMMLTRNNKMTLLMFVGLWLNVATAWLSTSTTGSIRSTPSLAVTTRLYQSSFHNEHEEEEPPLMRRNRASLEGVSLAPTGFWVMLRLTPDEYLPWQVTNDPSDAVAASSAEALTMIQLLSGVDMAGAILPPDVLAKLVLYHCEGLVNNSAGKNNDSGMFFASKQQTKKVTMAQAIVAFVQESLPPGEMVFSEAHSWAQSRAKLPEASLDEIVVSPSSAEAPFALTCTIRDFGSLTFTPSPESLEAVLYQYSPPTSLAFTSLALALRYKAPVTVETTTNCAMTCNEEQLMAKFPLYATTSTLQQSSHRVQQNIVRGFEIHKLSGALRIAMEKGDVEAAAKIRQALDDYDSMDELPTASLQEDGLLLQQESEEDLMTKQQQQEEIVMGGGGIGGFLPQQNMTMSVLQ